MVRKKKQAEETPNLPKFNLGSGDQGVTQEEFDEQSEKEKGGKVFAPGRYSLKVKSCEFHQMMEKDKTWAGYIFKFVGANGKEISDYIMVPTTGKVYFGKEDSKGRTFPFRKLRIFMAALGVDLTVDNKTEVVPEYFGDPEKFVGMDVEVDIGFNKYYAKYVAEEGEDPYFMVVSPDGKELTDDEGDVVTFDDREAAVAYGAERKITVETFPSITQYHEVNQEPKKKPAAKKSKTATKKKEETQKSDKTDGDW